MTNYTESTNSTETETMYLVVPGYESNPFTIINTNFLEDTNEFVFELKMKDDKDEELLFNDTFKETVRNFIVRMLAEITDSVDFNNDLVEST